MVMPPGYTSVSCQHIDCKQATRCKMEDSRLT